MKYSVLKITQTPLINQNGSVSYTFSVQFMVGQHGPFTMVFSQADFNPAKVQAELNQFAANIAAIAPTAAS